MTWCSSTAASPPSWSVAATTCPTTSGRPGCCATTPTRSIATHLAFYRAGADVATTASYQASVEGFARHGLPPPRPSSCCETACAWRRIAAALAEAEDGVRRWSRPRSDPTEPCGPTGRSTPATTASTTRSCATSTAGARRCCRLGPDLLAVETIPSEQEVTVLLEVLAELAPTTPAWLSLTCADEARTRRGEDVSRVFGLARSAPRSSRWGSTARPRARARRWSSGRSRRPASRRSPIPTAARVGTRPRGPGPGRAPSSTAALARTGWPAGATYVGGCCRVGSVDIGRLAQSLDR